MTARPDIPVMISGEECVWNMIRRRLGRARAISTRDIALFTGISERQVRTIVRRLRIAFHLPIGSATQDPAGYYLAQTAGELREVAETWKDFGLKQLVMAHQLLRNTPDEFIGQIAIDLERELATTGQ